MKGSFGDKATKQTTSAQCCWGLYLLQIRMPGSDTGGRYDILRLQLASCSAALLHF
jgi:hypothetical protein